MRRPLVVLCLILVFTLVSRVQAQDPPGIVTPLNDTGIHPFSAYDGAHENISTANGNLNIYLPLLTFRQRGGNPFELAVEYDSKTWSLQFFNNFDGTYDTFWQQDTRVPMIAPNWRLAVPTLEATASPYKTCKTYAVHDWVFTEANGTKHHFTAWRACQPPSAGNVLVAYSDDAAFFKIDITNQSDIVVYSRDGTAYHFKDFQGNNYQAAFDTIVDTNGNIVQTTKSTGSATGNPITAITDTVGRTFNVDLTNHAISFKDPNGLLRTISFTQLTGGTGNTITFNHPSGTDCGGLVGSNSFSVGNQTTAWKMTVPDGASNLTYQFVYDAAGELTQITYPSGGYTKYDFGAYSGKYQSHTFSCSNVDLREVIAKHECRRSDGNCGPSPAPTPEDTTTYTAVAGNRTNVSMDVFRPDPSGTPNKTHYQFSAPAFPDYISIELSRTVYSGSSTPLRTITTDYNLFSNVIRDFSLPIRVTTTLNDITPALTGKVETDYDTLVAGGTPNGNATEIREYDFGLVLARKTDNTWLKTTAYTNKNILSRKLSTTVNTGAGVQTAKTTYEYDNYTEGLTASGATQHQSTDNNRGNPTATIRWLSTTNSNLPPTRYQYDDAGNIRKVTNPLGNATTYSFGDSWRDSSCTPSSGAAAAYVTTITNALSQSVTGQYDSCSGLLAKVTDVNLQPTTYTYDLLGRVIGINYPDLGVTTRTYNDVPPASITENKQLSSSPAVSETSVDIHDGLGRTLQTQVYDPEGVDFVDITYDSLDRVASQSNPHRSSSSPTDGVTNTQYDALNRITKLIPSDGSTTLNNITTTYSGNCAIATDQAGKSRKSCSDGLGRLTQVFEDPAALNYETDYAYDVLNNLVSVNQKGGSATAANWRTRSFAYDSLSRQITAVGPESGTVTNTYDAAGRILTRVAPAPNQTGSATVTTCFGTWSGTSCDGLGYDALNRITKKSYSDGTTPTVTFLYDIASGWGNPTPSQPNLVGRLSLASVVSATPGNQVFGYDPMGRVVTNNQSTPYNVGTGNWSVTYTYDLAGNMTSYTNGQGVTFTQAFNAASRTTGLTSSYVNATHPATLISGVTHTPAGAVSQMTYGNGLAESAGYNSRLQPTQLRYYNPGTGVDSLNLTYGFNLGTADNGNVASMNSTGQQVFTRSYSYDSLNRIFTMTDSATGQACKGLSWTIDPWGNRTDQTVTSGTCNTFHQAADTNNRLSGAPYQHDSAGNMIHDASHSYAYDAENRLISVDGGATATYAYDAEGRRVLRVSSAGTIDYIRDLAGNVIAEVCHSCAGNTGWSAGHVYFNGSLVAQYTDSTYFIHSDHLGSTRLLTRLDESVYDNIDYLPFGEQIAGSSGSTHKFAGKERDAESGLDNFAARYLGSSLGRFMRPDPIMLSKLRVSDPQQWNSYAYVRNNPLRYTDPTGMYLCADSRNCDSKEDKAFEEARQRDLQSNDKATRDAAASYGGKNEDNGVNVAFAKDLPAGCDKTACVKPGIKYDEARNTITPNITVTFKEGLRGMQQDSIVAHEGVHVADDLSFINSYNPKTSSFDASKNFTHGDTEFRGFQVQLKIVLGLLGSGKDYELLGERFSPKDLQSQIDSKITEGLKDPANHYADKLNNLVFNPNDYPQH